MANLESLKPSITKLTFQEALGIILEVRKRRTEYKPPKKKLNTTTRKTKKQKVSALIDSMNSNELEALKKLLQK